METATPGLTKEFIFKLRPFDVNKQAQDIIRIVNEGGEQLDKLQSVLCADMSKPENRQKLYDYAKNSGWLKKEEENTVVVGATNNSRAYNKFRDTFSNALKFNNMFVDGNNRIIASMATSNETKVKKGMNFNHKRKGDPGYFGEADNYFDSTKSNMTALDITTTVHVRLYASKKQATKGDPARALIHNVLHHMSKMAAHTKKTSSEAFGMSKTSTVMDCLWSSDHGKVDRKEPITNGELYLNGKLFTKKNKKLHKDFTELNDDPLMNHGIVKEFYLHPEPSSKARKAALEAFKMKDGTGNFVEVFKNNNLSYENAIRKGSAMSNLRSKRFFMVATLAQCLGIHPKHLQSIIYGGVTEDSVIPKTDLPIGLGDKMNDESWSWMLESEEGRAEVLLTFTMDCLLAGNLLKQEPLVTEVWGKFILEMTNSRQNIIVSKRIGKKDVKFDSVANFFSTLTLIVTLS